jgi:hypothetical protein
VQRRTAAHTGRFRAFLCKISEIEDSMAERDGFEPSRPFISHMLP